MLRYWSRTGLHKSFLFLMAHDISNSTTMAKLIYMYIYIYMCVCIYAYSKLWFPLCSDNLILGYGNVVHIVRLFTYAFINTYVYVSSISYRWTSTMSLVKRSKHVPCICRVSWYQLSVSDKGVMILSSPYYYITNFCQATSLVPYWEVLGYDICIMQ